MAKLTKVQALQKKHDAHLYRIAQKYKTVIKAHEDSNEDMRQAWLKERARAENMTRQSVELQLSLQKLTNIVMVSQSISKRNIKDAMVVAFREVLSPSPKKAKPSGKPQSSRTSDRPGTNK